MGLTHGWKEILKKDKQIFGDCFGDLPADAKISTIIEDFNISMRTISYYVKSWKEIADRCTSRLINNFNPHLTQYIIAFDEGEFAPENKRPKQEKSAKSSPHLPFTAEELKHVHIGVEVEKSTDRGGTLFDPSKFPNDVKMNCQTFIERVLATRVLHPEFKNFLTAQLLSIKLLNKTMTPPLITIDGGHTQYYEENRANFTVSVKFYNERGDCNSMSEMPNKRRHNGEPIRSTASKIIVHPSTGDNRQTEAYIHESDRIGEADMKIPSHIKHQKNGGDILVISKDTDMIPIMLLSMRDWIDLESENVPFRIYLDLTPSEREKETPDSKNPPTPDAKPSIQDAKPSKPPKKTKSKPPKTQAEILDVLKLWRHIYDYFRKTFPKIISPLETFVTLMILTKTDYVLTGLTGIGPAVIWKSFLSGGFIYLGEQSEFAIIEHKCFVTSPPTGRSAVIADVNIGDPDAKHDIVLAEHKVYKFIQYVYANLHIPSKEKNKATRVERMTKNPDLDELRKIFSAKQDTYKKPGSRAIPSDRGIKAIIRRTGWNIDYWANGHKKNKFMNPIEVYETRDGERRSMFGWAKDAGGKIVETDEIQIDCGIVRVKS